MAPESASETPRHNTLWEDIENILTFTVAPILLFPWALVEWDVPKRTALRRWGWVYAVFAALTVVVFGPTLLQGTLWSLWPLLTIPFAHIVSGLALFIEVVGGSTPGVGYGGLPNAVFIGPYFLVSWLTIGVAWVRTRHPDWLGVDSHPYPREEGEYVLPMEFRPRHSEEGEPPSLKSISPIPTLQQDVSTAVIGETGSGKTSAIKLLAEQSPDNERTAIVAHDTGTDFEEYYSRKGKRVIRIGIDGSDVRWNLFRDIRKSRDVKEISNAVFGEPAGNNPFHKPAKQVFECCIRYLHRQAEEKDALDRVGRDDLLALIKQPQDELYKKLSYYDELAHGAAHIDPEGGNGASSVYSELVEKTMDVFVGDFAEDGDFSLQDYIADPSDAVLVFNSDPMGTAADPMFQVMLNWTIRIAQNSDTRTNFILDEIDALPAIDSLPGLAARGRSEGAVTILGVQTIGQLKDVYGGGSAGILGNCPQGIYFHPGDATTTEFILDELGEFRDQTVSRTRSTSSHDGASAQRSRTVSTEERHPVTSGELRKFDAGECVVVSKQHWWKGKLKELSEVADSLSR